MDFTYLRDSGRIQPVKPENVHGKKHYRVNYTMVIKVVDRDLQCKFPQVEIGLNAKPVLGYAIYDGEIKQKCKLNIAPAFRPGVK